MGKRKSFFDILRENCTVHEKITEYRTPSGKTIATGHVISWEPKRSYDYLNPLKGRELPRNANKGNEAPRCEASAAPPVAAGDPPPTPSAPTTRSRR